MSEAKYPDCEVQLVGLDGNAVAIFMRVARELKRYLINEENWTSEDARREVDRFKAEATSGSYDDLLKTCEKWVAVY